MTEPVEVTVARMDGKLDAAVAKLSGQLDTITLKVDANADLLLTRIEAGDRENAQKIALNQERLDGHERRLTKVEAKAEASGKFEARLVGIAAGIALFAGGAGVGIAKALGI